MSYLHIHNALSRLERFVAACGDDKSSGCDCDCHKTADSNDGYFGPQNTMNDYNYGGDFAHTTPDSYVDNPDYNRQTVAPAYDPGVVTSSKKKRR